MWVRSRLCIATQATDIQSESTPFAQGPFELGVNVTPFAHAHEGEEVFATEAAHLALGGCFQLIVVGLPDVEQGDKV